MIKLREHPVGWAELMSNMEDAHEHLGNLIQEMTTDPEFDDPEFAVNLGHVFAHLNRAWCCRNHPEGLGAEEWEAAGEFPKDLEPIA
jgi:hypothetical protein